MTTVFCDSPHFTLSLSNAYWARCSELFSSFHSNFPLWSFPSDGVYLYTTFEMLLGSLLVVFPNHLNIFVFSGSWFFVDLFCWPVHWLVGDVVWPVNFEYLSLALFVESWDPLGIFLSTETTLRLYIWVLLIRLMLVFFLILFICWNEMVVFCSLLRISFDVALLLLMMTLSRYVKIRTFPYGSWLTVITTCDGTSCIVLVLFLFMFNPTCFV